MSIYVDVYVIWQNNVQRLPRTTPRTPVNKNPFLVIQLNHTKRNTLHERGSVYECGRHHLRITNSKGKLLLADHHLERLIFIRQCNPFAVPSTTSGYHQRRGTIAIYIWHLQRLNDSVLLGGRFGTRKRQHLPPNTYCLHLWGYKDVFICECSTSSSSGVIKGRTSGPFSSRWLD